MTGILALDGPLLDRIEINPNHTPSASIIRLHGLGADGYDFDRLLVTDNTVRIVRG